MVRLSEPFLCTVFENYGGTQTTAVVHLLKKTEKGFLITDGDAVVELLSEGGKSPRYLKDDDIIEITDFRPISSKGPKLSAKGIKSIGRSNKPITKYLPVIQRIKQKNQDEVRKIEQELMEKEKALKVKEDGISKREQIVLAKEEEQGKTLRAVFMAVATLVGSYYLNYMSGEELFTGLWWGSLVMVGAMLLVYFLLRNGVFRRIGL